MESTAAEWLRWMGFEDATITGGSADGGIDVEASGVVAQVKDEGKKTQPKVVREIRGVAAGRGKQSACFSRAGYTEAALNEGDELGVALFEFDLQGQVEPANGIAETWLRRPEGRS